MIEFSYMVFNILVIKMFINNIINKVKIKSNRVMVYPNYDGII